MTKSEHEKSPMSVTPGFVVVFQNNGPVSCAQREGTLIRPTIGGSLDPILIAYD